MDFFGRDRKAAQNAVAEVERAVKLSAQGRHEEALRIFDDVVQRHTRATHLGLKAAVANALYHKGVTLALRGLDRDAVDTWRELERGFGPATEPEVADWVVRGLFNIAVGRQRHDDSAAAIELYEDVVRRCDAQRTEPFIELLCDSLSNVVLLLHETGQQERALLTGRRLLARLGAPQRAGKLVHKLNTLGAISGALRELGRYDEALPIIDEVLELIRGSNEHDQIERTVSMLNNKGTVLLRLERHAAAASAYGAAFDASRACSEPDAILYGARALLNKATALHMLHAFDDELAALSLAIDHFAGKPEPPLTEVSVKALVRSEELLQALGRSAEAEAVRARLIALGEQLRDADDQQLAARALLSHAPKVEDLGERLELLDAVVSTLAKHPGAARDQLMSAQALSTKGLELAHAEQLDAAIVAWDDALATVAGRQDDDAAVLIARTLLSRAIALAKLACADEALRGFEQVVTRFDNLRGAEVSAAVLAARDSAVRVRRWNAEKRAAYPQPLTVSETIASLAAPVAHASAKARELIPHFVNASLVPGTLTADLSYATHDSGKHALGETGLALLAGFVQNVRARVGKRPGALVIKATPDLGDPGWPDSNHQLMSESTAVFGLPMRVAALHTHASLCARRLSFPLRDVGWVAGTFIFNFEADE